MTSGTRWCGYRSSRRRPASLREVTAPRSNSGCCQSRRAASAPAKPDAPRTATSGTLRHPDRVELGQDLVAHLADLVVGQRAVGRGELEVQRQRDDAVALEAIEDRRVAQQ